MIEKLSAELKAETFKLNYNKENSLDSYLSELN